MGAKAKMSNAIGVTFPFLCLIAMAMIFVMAGCENINPPPAIEVEQIDTESWTGVTVYYQHHQRTNNFIYIELNSPEEIRAYKEKVEFLLTRLEEAEMRMSVHEDVPME